MTGIAGQPIVTAAEMRAAEAACIAGGVSTQTLMARAGAGVAEWVRRLHAGHDVLILCGPGNNGGDGYVAATILRNAGVAVRVAATGMPRSEAAAHARLGWTGPIEEIQDALSAPIIVDALFGTGLSRGLEPALAARLGVLVGGARLAVAVDLPSGAETESGAVLSPVPDFQLTLALGALKPAHLLQPAARHSRAVRVIDIGVTVESATSVVACPALAAPGPDTHKYSRGMVAVMAGAMPGAATLAATAALRGGAGYVALIGGAATGVQAIVQRAFANDVLSDRRIGAVVIGPGLGRGTEAERRLAAAIKADCPLVIDGDALHLLDLAAIADRSAAVVLTPHQGEFDALFGMGEGGKIDRARVAAQKSGATVIFKGADTVIAAPNGKVRIGEPASCWLSTAGTGDVLAGLVGAMLAGGLAPLEAASAAVWMHGEAARHIGGAFIADDLAAALSDVRAAL